MMGMHHYDPFLIRQLPTKQFFLLYWVMESLTFKGAKARINGYVTAYPNPHTLQRHHSSPDICVDGLCEGTPTRPQTSVAHIMQPIRTTSPLAVMSFISVSSMRIFQKTGSYTNKILDIESMLQTTFSAEPSVTSANKQTSD